MDAEMPKEVESAVEHDTSSSFARTFGLLWRRQWVIYLCLLLTSGAAFLYYAAVGERYEAYVLLRAGQGIKERSSSNAGASPFGEGVDLQSRMESLSRIAKIDLVILEAAKNVGYERLSSDSNPTLLAKFMAWGREIDLRDMFANESGEPKAPAKPVDETEEDIERNQEAILSLRDRVTAKQEGRSDLLKITFRHRNPVVAASYLNELANTLVAIQGLDVQMPGAQEFFQQQTKRLEEDAEIAAADLKRFSVEASIYAVDEQRQLLLRRASDLSALIATTRGAIEDKKGQKLSVVDQLAILRPVAQNKAVSRMVTTLGGQDGRKSLDPVAKPPEQFEEQPPLLLIKVYQDNMAALMKLNSELNGQMELLHQLGIELEKVNKELASLSAKEAEYGRLKRVLATASAAAAQYATRILEEQISSEVAKKSQLSSVRVVQKAVTPIAPVFPQVSQLVALALAGGVLLGLGGIFGPELARGTMHRPVSRSAAGIEEYDPIKNLLIAAQRGDGVKELHPAGRADYDENSVGLGARSPRLKG
ncbi:GNVR domain-containing protein [Bradyrhizobium yuanmingense]|uniref:GNVR domain-containing protein n=1 Tax=Bradyrhizobium yuanmingense TaxID=108015 RepID=UPI0023BA1285|nr:GNVR domain-containing protein [Bradyrhizobium yuanmingense]MDF0521352.1 GNVR domain-containing protein [Bradyrhizobium yuanmingense]